MSEDLNKIIQMRKSGKTTLAIATELGIKEARVTYLLHKNGVKLDSEQRSKNSTDYDPAKIIELRTQGLTIKEVAARIGCSLDVVKRAQRAVGFKCPKDISLRNLRAGVKTIPKEVRNNIGLKSHSAEANAIRSKKMTDKYSDPEARRLQSQTVRAAFEKRGAYSKYTLQDMVDKAIANGIAVITDSPLNLPWKMSESLTCKCHCGNFFETRPHDMLYGKVKSCGCVKSSYELELLAFFKEEGFSPELGNLLYNNKKTIAPLQLDFYIPEKALAVEFCGLFYHSQFGVDTDKPSSYHIDKYVRCKALGITLVTIFSDEWLSVPDVCKKILRSYLGKQSERIFAKDLYLKECTQEQAKTFLIRHHLQGFTNDTYIGLFDDDSKLEAVMGHSLQKDINDNPFVSISRFCVDKKVVGGFAKLLNNLRISYPNVPIVTFSDNRWFSGDIYLKNGFLMIQNLRQDYWYTKGDTDRHHKSKFRKEKIEGILPNETEREAMFRLGYGRIWDCGKKKWVLK